jgi:hypothetical protein
MEEVDEIKGLGTLVWRGMRVRCGGAVVIR